MITLNSTSVSTSRLGWTKANNKVWYKIIADSSFDNFGSYTVLLEVSLLGGGVLFSQKQSPDANGEIFFEVNGILDDIMQKEIFANDNQLPTFNQSVPRITDQPYTFALKFTDFQDSTAGTVIERTVKAISAGLDYDDFSHQKQREWLYEDHKFFTSTSDPKPACPDVEDYIYFYNTYSYRFIDVWVSLYYKDGTFDSYRAYINFDTAGKTIIIPSGYNELGIEANRDLLKRLDNWRVWVTKHNDDTLRLSEALNYVLDEQFTLEKRKFLFGNSLSGYETFYCKASIEEQITSKKTTYKRLYGQEYRLRDGETFAGMQEGKRRIQAATGWLSNDFAEALQDAAISKEVWEITDKGFIPVIIDSISAVYYEKNNELIGYVFAGTYGYEVELYTKDIERAANGLPPFVPEPTYIESISCHVRGIVGGMFKPVIELNEKIDAFTLNLGFGVIISMLYKYSEAPVPNFDLLPTVTYTELLTLIANGSGNYKIQFNPTLLSGYNEATFRFEYDVFGVPSISSYPYSYALAISIDTVILFNNNIQFTSIAGQSANSTFYNIRTNAATVWVQPTPMNIATLNAAILLIAPNTPYEIQLINTYDNNLTLNYNYV